MMPRTPLPEPTPTDTIDLLNSLDQVGREGGEEPTGADPFPEAAAARRDLLEYLDAGWDIETPAQEGQRVDSTPPAGSPSAEVAPTPAQEPSALLERELRTPPIAPEVPERRKTLAGNRRQEAIDRARDYLTPRPGQQKAWAEEMAMGYDPMQTEEFWEMHEELEAAGRVVEAVKALTAYELTAAAMLGEQHGYQVWPAKLLALRDALYPEEGDQNV